MEDKIKEQVQNAPLTKEESREQFYRMTEEFGIKHSFDFDEAWEIGLEIRSRMEFREKMVELEKEIIAHGIEETELHEANPVKHTFAGGCYIREIYNPANKLLITKIHKKEHPFFLMKGYMSILTEDGIEHIRAPYQGVTKPGTKRAIYTHEECIFITVHSTDNTSIKDVEEEVVCTNYEDLPPGCDAIEMLKSINLKE